MGVLRLNVGSGPKYMDGWINLDACDMFKRDRAILLPDEKLVDMFGKGVVDEIFMSDLMEHFYRCDGIEVLKDFYGVLKSGGIVQIITPDLERIITSPHIDLRRKTELIRGAQGQPIFDPTPETLRVAWGKHPKWFSHPYTWTEIELRDMLTGLGFVVGETKWLTYESMQVSAVKL